MLPFNTCVLFCESIHEQDMSCLVHLVPRFISSLGINGIQVFICDKIIDVLFNVSDNDSIIFYM